MDKKEFLRNCTQIELALAYLGRRALKPNAREGMWKLAVTSFEVLFGNGDEWANFGANVIAAVSPSSSVKRRNELLDLAFDIYEDARVRFVEENYKLCCVAGRGEPPD